MRKISEYSFSSILKLRPLVDFLREKRNDIMLHYYLKKTKPAEEFLEKNKELYGQNIIGVIAFEQPLVLDWLIKLYIKNVTGFALIIFDNSTCEKKSSEIEIVCKKNATKYLRIPKVNSGHVNRSHGLALTWAYTNVIKKLDTKIFGFIDHDLIPIAPIDPSKNLNKQDIYGVANIGINGYWNLWAGFCFYSALNSCEKLNFLYDFSRGLDTGGRNWGSIYKKYNKDQLIFASNEVHEIENSHKKVRRVQFIDKNWIHIGSIGYNGNFDEKKEFFEILISEYLE